MAKSNKNLVTEPVTTTEPVVEENPPASKKITLSELKALERFTKIEIAKEICDKKGMQYPKFADQKSVTENFLETFIINHQ